MADTKSRLLPFAALKSIKQNAISESRLDFCCALISACPGLEELWRVWLSQSSRGTTPVTVALLSTLQAMLSIHIPLEEKFSPIVSTLKRFSWNLVSKELPRFYRFCSSGDHTKANHALQLLATAASYTPSHTMQFLSSFNFSFNMLPKIAAPQLSKHPPTQPDSLAGKTVAPGTNSMHAHANWSHPDLAKRPTRSLFLQLVNAVLNSAPAGAGVAMVLRAPQLLPLAMHHLSKDPPSASRDVCVTLLRKVFSPGKHPHVLDTAVCWLQA